MLKRGEKRFSKFNYFIIYFRESELRFIDKVHKNKAIEERDELRMRPKYFDFTRRY